MTCVWYEDYVQVAAVAVLNVATVAGVTFNLKSNRDHRVWPLGAKLKFMLVLPRDLVCLTNLVKICSKHFWKLLVLCK